jgi:hypothetical protein
LSFLDPGFACRHRPGSGQRALGDLAASLVAFGPSERRVAMAVGLVVGIAVALCNLEKKGKYMTILGIVEFLTALVVELIRVGATEISRRLT